MEIVNEHQNAVNKLNTRNMKNMCMQKQSVEGRNPVLSITLLLLATTMFFVCGCARIPLNYSPGSVSKISGNISVSDFKYLPAATGKIKSYQVDNTAFLKLEFDKDIGIYFKDAVSTEFRQAGIKLDNKILVLNGDIEEFLIDELRAYADITLKVNYRVINLQTEETIYVSTKTTRREASKLLHISRALNEMIKLNIEELLNDEKFIKVIHKNALING